MKGSRFLLDWAMILAMLAALNVAAARGLFALVTSGPRPHPVAAWGWGAVLMADVLVLAIPIGLASRRGRPFLWGFEAFGVAALASYVALAIAFAEELLVPLAGPILGPLVGFLARDGLSTLDVCVLFSAAGIVAAALQVAFALAGGLLFHLLRVADRAERAGSR